MKNSPVSFSSFVFFLLSSSAVDDTDVEFETSKGVYLGLPCALDVLLSYQSDPLPVRYKMLMNYQRCACVIFSSR